MGETPNPQRVVEAREEILRILQDHIKLKHHPRGINHPAGGLPYIAGWEAAADALLFLKLKGAEHG